MDTLYDLVSVLDGERDALRWDGRAHSARELRTTTYRAGNFLRHHGVREGVDVVVADDSVPQAVFSALGATLLGAAVRFGLPDESDARAVVGPADDIGAVSLPPGGQRVAYGDEPTDPSWGYFERDAWSENPAFPPVGFDGETTALRTEDTAYSHAALLDAAETVADGLDANDVVAVRGSLTDPGVVVAGLLAPHFADAVSLLPTPDETGTVAVGGEDVPEDRVMSPSSVSF
ncbi:acetyl-CoA synthetase [Halospeciosus flavus]|uniref:Acetyl-CoA synthetase n=1 Tax=Halospeciosus flavus TaxID=3032283 RepID=A0ABD5Z4J0_9EURY|nr:acetyl-CoA synthetase [Halospeciosus flavus]